MDAFSMISKKGEATTVGEFMNTVKLFPRSAWNAYPNRHYLGMISIEQTDSGWRVGIGPAGAGESVNVFTYRWDEEERMAMEIGRKLHPTLICTCASANECFKEACPVRP